MKKNEALAQILREWLSLPTAERTTESQAARFAMKIKDKYEFKCAADRYQEIKGILARHLAGDQ